MDAKASKSQLRIALRQISSRLGASATPRLLERTGGRQGMSLGGARLFVGGTDDGHAIHQLPVIRIGNGKGERILVACPGLPFDEPARDRARSRPDPRRASRESSGSLRFSPAALLPASASAANAEAEEAIPAPEGKLLLVITSARSRMPAFSRMRSRI